MARDRPARANPPRSKRCAPTGASGSIRRNAPAMAAAQIGRLTRNSSRQCAISTSAAPINGPISGPISTGIVSHVMASSVRPRPKARSTIMRPTGVINAPPNPWIRRKGTIIHSSGIRAQSTDAAMKTPIAPQNTRRAPKRSANQPDTGMNTARLSR